MALTYPLSLASFYDLLPVASAPFLPVEQVEISGQGSGVLLPATMGPTLIEVDVVLKPVSHGNARKLRALLEAAKDGAFYFCDPRNHWPTHDRLGTTLGGSTVTVLSVNADNVRLALQGLPVGYVLENDLIAIDYGSPTRRALVRMMGSATADGSGETAQFEVRPALRAGIATGCVVTLKKPAIKARFVPNSLGIDDPGTSRETLSFRIRQTLQAG